MILEAHPLRQLFTDLIDRHYEGELHIHNPEVKNYLVNLLLEFSSHAELLKLRNSDGKRIHDLGEMLLESDPIYGPAPSFDRERQVRKHVGDIALFFTGMFPESINHPRLRRQRLENFVDWVRAGKESYYVVSKFEYFECAKVAPLFATLSQRFEDCVHGLNLVKNELEVIQYPLTPRNIDIIV